MWNTGTGSKRVTRLDVPFSATRSTRDGETGVNELQNLRSVLLARSSDEGRALC